MQFLAKNKKLLELGPSPRFLIKKKRVRTGGCVPVIKCHIHHHTGGLISSIRVHR